MYATRPKADIRYISRLFKLIFSTSAHELLSGIMPIKANLVIRRAMTAAMITLVVIPVTSLAKEPKYQALQLVRYVLETPELPHSSLYFDKIRKRVLIYDDEYRHPDKPHGPAQVACANTRRIGMTYYLIRARRIMPKHVKTHVIWAHSNVESDNSSMDYYHAHYFIRRQNAVLESHGLELTEELRVDGVLTVRVSVGKYEILENSFHLIGCPIVTQ